MRLLDAESVACKRMLSIGLIVTIGSLAAGCRDYGIREGDNPQIIALKKLGATVTYGMGDSFYIDLNDAGVDDDDLIHFEELPTVITLDLGDNHVTDEGLNHLVAGSVNLQSLMLNGTEVTDAGLELLKAMPRLTALSLGGTQVTDEGLATIVENHRGLKSLTLIGCEQITNEGLKSISKLRRLSALALTDCPQITDEGLEYLKGMRSFEIVHLMNTGCTNKGVDKFTATTGALLVVNTDGKAAGAMGKLIAQ